ncbi:F-box domain-containing protein [Favolaschia claudopus]|uniref:F-box domain-containing protein n=1 Tax=Favolaschia claudopus TaxID=2862362 RepID=A0AAV9ZE02_9AGAR
MTESHPSYVISRRAEITKQLAILNAQISLLKGEYNALSSVSILPNEILVQILSGVQDPTSTYPNPLLVLTRLMLVCKHWCEVMLASPTLWSKICGGWQYRSNCLTVQLARSGEAPLLIKLSRLGNQFDGPTVLQHARRIQTLEIGGSPRYVLAFMQDMADFDFPILTNLVLNPIERASESEDDTASEAIFPSELFERIPRLCNLSLSRINARWETLPPLRSLSLTAHSPAGNGPLPFSMLVQFLQSSPFLETLRLDMMIPEHAPEGVQKITLSHLTVLYIRDFIQQCEALVKLLDFPPTTQLQLYTQSVNNGSHVRDILLPIRRHLRAPGAPLIQTLVLQAPFIAGSIAHCSVSCFTTNFDSKQGAALDEWDGHFMINTHPRNAPALRQILSKILKALPSQSLTFLDATQAQFSRPTWKMTLALLPALHTVRLYVGAGGANFCDAASEMKVSFTAIDLRSFIRARDPDGAQEDDPELEEIAPFFEALKRLLLPRNRTEGKTLGRLTVRDYFGALNFERSEWEEMADKVEVAIGFAAYRVEESSAG